MEHSLAETLEFEEYLARWIAPEKSAGGQRTYWFWKDNKAPKDSVRKFILRWIENEQLCCFASAEYFATRYARIRDVEERVIPFSHRIAQRIFHEALAEADESQTAIQLFILKARQLGCSTVVAIYFLHRILFRSHTYAVMASVQKPQSEKLAAMIDLTLSRIPFWLGPGKTVAKLNEPRWDNGSALSVQSGSQEVGIAQGTTPTAVHISEVGDYAHPERVLDEGLFPACHQTRSLFLVLEGTGATSTPWQKSTWDYSVANWGKGARFRPFFIPPACATDLYPPPDWLRDNPIPAAWTPDEATRRMRRRGELFVRSTNYLNRLLGYSWEMPPEFQYYWECGYREAVSKGVERKFLAQMASTPDDAFQSENESVFSRNVIEVVGKERQRAYVSYAVTGRSILMGEENAPYSPHPADVDSSADRIPLWWEGADGNDYAWTLIPLRQFDDSRDELCFDRLLIFEPPEAGAEYAIGIDTAHGLNTPNEDRTKISVHRKGRNDEADVQVAAFSSIRIRASQTGRIAAALAVLYGTDGRGNVTSSNPLIVRFVIEQVRKAGDDCMDQLKIMGFLDHHKMHRYDNAGQVDHSKGTKGGWYTHPWSRPILLERFIEAVTNGWLILNDPVTIRELDTFVRKYKGQEGKPFMDHDSGGHSDGIFAAAMAWITLHDNDNVAHRLERRNRPKQKQQVASSDWCRQCLIIE